MKKIIFFIMIFLLIGSVCASDFSKVTLNGVEFEIPSQYSNGDLQDTKYVYKDYRTFAILCVDDYIISNYGGNYDIAELKQDLNVDNRPVKLLTTYNKYIDKNVSYLYFPVNDSVYCICFQGNNINGDISHIVESAPKSDMSSDTFYGLLDEVVKEHQNRKYLDAVSDNDNYNYVSQKNQHKDNSNNRLLTWYLLSHRR